MTRITKRSLYQTPYRDPSRATLEPSPPFCPGKIIIYVNSNLHKLYFLAYRICLLVLKSQGKLKRNRVRS